MPCALPNQECTAAADAHPSELAAIAQMVHESAHSELDHGRAAVQNAALFNKLGEEIILVYRTNGTVLALEKLLADFNTTCALAEKRCCPHSAWCFSCQCLQMLCEAW